MHHFSSVPLVANSPRVLAAGWIVSCIVQSRDLGALGMCKFGDHGPR